MTLSNPIHEVWLTIAMTPEPDPEDVKLLVESINTRQKIPRVLPRALRAIREAREETTARIFFDCGGPAPWAAYFLTKLAGKKTGHVPKRGQRQRLVLRLEQQPIEARRALARQVKIALEPDRARIELLLETAALHATRNRQLEPHENSSSAADNDADIPDAPIPVSPIQARGLRPAAASPSLACEGPQAPQAMDLRNMAQYFSSEPGNVLVHAVIFKCTQLFPPYFAGAIRRYPLPDNADVFAAAVSITLPRHGETGCLMRVEIIGSKVDHIAQELFGVHFEAEEGCRYIYLPGGSKADPYPRLVLRDCRLDHLHHFFGARVADAIRTTPTCQMDIKEGRDHTSCVSMVVPSAVEETGNIYVLLCQNDAALLRESLYS